MSLVHPDDPAFELSEVALYPEEDRDLLLPLGAWLDVVAGDEPVDLPRPAAEYLIEARAAGDM